MPARTGFRSIYAAIVRTAVSESSTCTLLYRSSQTVPLRRTRRLCHRHYLQRKRSKCGGAYLGEPDSVGIKTLLQFLHEAGDVPHPVQILLPQLRRRLLKPTLAKTLQLPGDLLHLGVAVDEFEVSQQGLVRGILERVGLGGIATDEQITTRASGAP